MDIAKRLIDFGFHPPTVYSPLVVPGAVMIEPTDIESKEGLDKLVTAFRKIAEQARNDPAAMHEPLAARNPCLTG